MHKVHFVQTWAQTFQSRLLHVAHLFSVFCTHLKQFIIPLQTLTGQANLFLHPHVNAFCTKPRFCGKRFIPVVLLTQPINYGFKGMHESILCQS